MASPLRKWMRKEEVYDKDLETLLDEAGIKNPPGDFKSVTAKQWDEIVRKVKVERFKELKDQASRNRLEKKLKKIEKTWRKESGIKSTSIKKGKGGKKKGGKKKADSGTDDAKKQKEAMSSNAKLKKFMQKNQIWEVELFMILTDMGVEAGEDLKDKITSNAAFDEVYRQVRVKRAKTLKDNDAKLRMEKLMTKFEKLWRKQSGIKKTAQTKNTKKAKKGKAPKDKKADELSGKGAKLKKWMKKNAVWEKQLYEECVRNNIEDEESLKSLTEGAFDEIIRAVRVEKFKELKDQASRNRVDKLLVKFEKIWRKESGIKKTSIQKKDAKEEKDADGADDAGDDAPADDAADDAGDDADDAAAEDAGDDAAADDKGDDE